MDEGSFIAADVAEEEDNLKSEDTWSSDKGLDAM